MMVKSFYSVKESVWITIFLSIFVITLDTQAQSPNAPEAASFEPVDATDMVNLVTGDFTYVLPLLNVPSPEGGYPIALSYHAGIAMDQEASWVGLGWNINPGAINRSVNGVPDDWKNALVREFAYDEGGQESTTSVSVGVGVPGQWSVGVGVSWGSNQSLGGSVSFSMAGVYGSIGTSGLSGGFGFSDHFGAGASIGFNGSVGISANFGLGQNANQSLSLGVGYGPGGFNGSVGFSSKEGITDSAGKVIKTTSSSSLGINFSSSGIGFIGNANGYGTSVSVSFSNPANASDYEIRNKSSQFMLVSPWGYFSFGKNTTSWRLNKIDWHTVKGSMDIEKKLSWINPTFNSYSSVNTISDSYDVVEINTDNRLEQMAKDTYTKENNNLFPNFDNYNVSGQGINGSITPVIANNIFLESYRRKSFYERGSEHLVIYSNLSNSTAIQKPIYFDFNSFTSSFLSILPYDMSYDSSQQSVNFSYPTPPTTPSDFSLSQDNRYIYLNDSFDEGKHKLRKGKYVEYFTVEEINSGVAATRGYLTEANEYPLTLEACGLVNANIDYNVDNFNKSMGGFKITMPDGKVYHYSLPVYQIEKVRRLYGLVEDKTENQAHMDRMQVNPYATHWLLTAITGPDYVKTNISRNYPDEGDYGYWVRFDYGNWSEGHIWKTPNGSQYSKDVDIFGKVKEYSWGRKQLYYLDKIKTRTHTALFIKKLRQDLKSEQLSYQNMTHHFVPEMQDMNVYWEPTLALDKILLLKNEDAQTIDKASGQPLINSRTYQYHLSGLYGYETNPRIGTWMLDQEYFVRYDVNKSNEVLDVNDISSGDIAKAVKVIRMEHNTQPHTCISQPTGTCFSSEPSGSLGLQRVFFGGKGGVEITPSLVFTYEYNWGNDYDNRGDFGYYKGQPQSASLTRITTPTGANINVAYEPDSYNKVAIKNGKVFTSKLKFSFLTTPPQVSNEDPATMGGSPTGTIQVKIEIDDQDPDATGINLADHFDPNEPFFMDMWYSAVDNYGGSGFRRSTIDIQGKMANIIELNSTSNYIIAEVTASSPGAREVFQSSAEPVSVFHASNNYTGQENQNKARYELPFAGDGDNEKYSMRHTVIGNKIISSDDSGIRVKEISVDNGAGEIYTTTYNYNDPVTGQTSGILPYYPEPNYAVSQQAPYISLLPGPVVTYEYVTESNGNMSKQFRFKVLDEIDTSVPGQIMFGDLLKIECTEQVPELDVNLKDVVINNNISSLGRMEELTLFNSENQVISHTKNNYAPIDQQFSLGQHKQSYYSQKDVNDYYFNNSKIFGSVSQKIDQFNELRSTTVSSGNTNSTQYFDKYDFMTGQLLEATNYDSEGKIIKTKVIPAYLRYSDMGSKVDDVDNKNMLTQIAANYTLIVDEITNTEKVVNASITKWNNQWDYRDYQGTETSPQDESEKIWRKHKSFVWKGSLDSDGTYSGFDINSDDSFVWGVGIGQTNLKWQETSETTRYNHFSNPMESKDINENYASVRTGDDDTKVIATSKAKLTDMYYSGAEYLSEANSSYFDSEIKSQGRVLDATAHTGNYVVRVTQGQHGFEVNVPPDVDRIGIKERFKVSVWVKTSQKDNAVIKVGGQSVAFKTNETQIAGDWSLLTGYITISSSGALVAVTSTNGSIDFDDFRLHPISSSMTSYVYNEWDELSYVIGSNGLAIYYKYDAAGRLIETDIEVVDNPLAGIIGGFKSIVTNKYEYQRN